MAFTSAGGREYYSNVRKLTSGITNCTSGMVKGIWKPDGNTLTLNLAHNPTKRPDKASDYVGTGRHILCQKYNTTSSSYDPQYSINSDGDVDVLKDELFTVRLTKTEDGFTGMRYSFLNPHAAMVDYQNAGNSVILIKNDVSYTRAKIESGTIQTQGLAFDAKKGHIAHLVTTGNFHRFYVQFAERFRVDGSGVFTYGTHDIVGNADATQLTIKANSTQTNDIFQIQDSSASNLVVVDGAGKVGIGTIPTAFFDVKSSYTADAIALFTNTNTGGDGVRVNNYSGGSLYYALYVSGDNGSIPILFCRADGNVGIGTLAPTERTQINGNLFLQSDSDKIYLGAGKDTSLLYDGTDFKIDTGLVTASDFVIDCGTNKTLELAETVWEDIQFPISAGKQPASSAPTWATLTTNTGEYGFDVNEYIDLASNELCHKWKEGTDGDFHMHLSVPTANTSGSSQYAKFTIYISYVNSSYVWTETSLTAEVEVIDGTPALRHFYLGMSTVSFSGLTIGTQVKLRVKRIAATGGTEYPSYVFIHQIGCHIECDTIGSRTISTK